ncbi:hypothetical protein [Mycolicibacterium bacteremicum]|uniref:hypothetical protein n=1 Tax=Mycolicibacterium bacteremicum TaxID=564198 RepID=UPI0026EEFA51|nr:hypothetical protein [Mycolicibacterium bacteremicum]
MTLTTVAWLVGTAGILFAVWEVVRRIRAGAAHIRHCIDTFEPSPPPDRPANRPADASQGDAR